MNRRIGLSFAVGSLAIVIVTAGFVGFFSDYPYGQNRSDKIGIRGHMVIKAYHADGTLYWAWEGDNVVEYWAKNAIAACVTGNSTTPYLYGSCSGWIDTIRLTDPAPIPSLEFYGSATSTLLPDTCNPAVGPTLCTWGWRTKATVEITQSATIDQVDAGKLTAAGFIPFDIVNLSSSPIVVSEGDRLIVTITFTIA